MSRLSFSRRIVGLALAAAVVGAGLGLGAVAVWPGSGADAQPTSGVGTPTTTSPSTTTSPTTSPSVPSGQSTPSSPATPPPPPASSRVTLGGATAIADRVAPGRVTKVKEDDEALGLRYDVTLVHADGTSTDVEVDAATGRVLSITQDDDRDPS